MSIPPFLPRAFAPGVTALLLPLAFLAACAEAPQQTRSEQAQYDACHRQADQVVEQANVNALSQSDPISSPYAATSILPGSTTDLSVEHQRQDVMNDCLHHLDSNAPNTGIVTATPASAPAEAPITPPPPDLAGPPGNDLTKPPILPPSQ